MNCGLFELFKISAGSSSTHGLAPMLAGRQFINWLVNNDLLHTVDSIYIEFFGSLALAGKAQGADIAAVLGLMNLAAENMEFLQAKSIGDNIKKNKVLSLNDQRHIQFSWQNNIIFHTNLPITDHSNAISFTAKDLSGNLLAQKTYYSTGQGNILEKKSSVALQPIKLPFVFYSMSSLTALCQQHKKSIAEVVFDNEQARAKNENQAFELEDLYLRIDKFWSTTKSAIERGVHHHGSLPGGLNIGRRAPYLHEKIKLKVSSGQVVDNGHWINLFALAVCEENASGGQVVSAPSNGAAGVIASVIAYYNRFISNDNKAQIRNFYATAAAIGSLYKSRSLEAPQLGCQGEIGVACSMAAGALVAAKQGSLAQIEHAAQIAMEHNIGLTCDPLGDLVQAPCIERNCMAAVKAINAAKIAMTTGTQALVNLDEMILKMQKTGLAMQEEYKASVLGDGSKNLIPVNIVYC